MNLLEIDSIKNELEKINNTPLPLHIISKPSIIPEEEKPFVKINNLEQKPGDIIQI